MTFEDRITVFSDRFLRERTFELIVAPALADFQFDVERTPGARTAHYVAVLRAVAGAVYQDLTSDSWTFAGLALLPACYYTFLLIVFSDFFSAPSGFVIVGTLILLLSLGPVLACYWPERYAAPPLD